MCGSFKLFFFEPVDPVAMKCPDYPTKVTSPMDLGTMETKLNKGQYPSTQAFQEDFDLIVSNAELYNGAGHNITLMAKQMEETFTYMIGAPYICPALQCHECEDCRQSEERKNTGMGKRKHDAGEPSRPDRAAKMRALKNLSEEQDSQLEEVGL